MTIRRIQNFLNNFFEQECITHREYRKENNINNYNIAFEELNSFTVNEDDLVYSKIGFGLTKLSEWHDEDFFEELEFLPEINPRHLYKISEYLINGESIWLCYVSNTNPSNGITKLLSNCFVIKEVNNELKITTLFIPDYDTREWKKVGGYDLNYNELGQPISVERFLTPSNDEWSIEEYEKNS